MALKGTLKKYLIAEKTCRCCGKTHDGEIDGILHEGHLWFNCNGTMINKQGESELCDSTLLIPNFRLDKTE